MFGLFKSKIETTTRDLEDCINFLSREINHNELQAAKEFIYEEVSKEWVKILKNPANIRDSESKWTFKKNEILLNKRLNNHRDKDFCVAYILLCFFFFCRMSTSEDGKVALARMQKIIGFLGFEIGNKINKLWLNY